MSLYGSKERQENLKKGKCRVQNKTVYIIHEIIPELKTDTILNELTFMNKVRLVQDRLKTEFEPMNQYLTARNYFSKYINEGNKKGDWSYPVPEPLIRLQRANPLRTLNWFLNTKNVSHWAKSWDLSFEIKMALQKDAAQDLLPEILCSAMMYGGLCVIEAITSLANQLISNPKKTLFSCNGLFWVDLEFDDGTQILNKRINNGNGNGNKELSLRRWYPDNLTLLRINKYLVNKTQQSEFTELNSNSCWKMIKAYLSKINPEAAKPLKSFNLFCRSAIGYTENLQGVDLNQALVEYANGRNLSASLSMESQSNLFNKDQSVSLKTKKFAEIVAKTKSCKGKPKILNQVAYEPLIRLIREAIKKHDVNGFKVSQATCQDALEAILTTYNVPINAVYLIEWLVFLLNRNTVSTIYTYFSSIGILWIANTINIDPALLDENELENLYSSMLNDEFTERTRLYKENRIRQIHTFCHRQFGFPYLESFDSSSSHTLRGFVRTGFITENQFSDIINAVDDITNIENIVDKYSLKCIFIIAFRTGMRLSEILKLRLKDLENSEALWVYILNNRIDNNKSDAARRKLPLALLLTNDELRFVRTFISKRLNITNNNTNTLLFSGLLNEYLPLDKQAISKVFKFIVSQLFEQELTFHHLRHTALSRLQLVIEGEMDFIEQISLYSPEQVRSIQSALGSYHREGVNKDKYWVLAGVSGHNTPESTFYSYLHFTDLLLGKQLANYDKTLSRNELKNISGLSVRKINSMFQDKNEIPLKVAVLSIEDSLTKNSQKVGGDSCKTEKRKHTNNSHLQIEHKTEQGFETCISALKKAEDGATIIEICNQLNVDELTLKKWLVNAQDLSSLTTTKGKSRLFSSQKKIPISGRNLLPTEVASHIEFEDVSVIINALRHMFREEKPNIEFCIEYFLEHKNHESPGLAFKNPQELKIFTDLLSKVLPRKRLNLSFSSVDNTEQKESLVAWGNCINKVNLFESGDKVKNKNMYPHGKIELFLSHPNEEELIKNKSIRQYSTNALGFVFHMLAIMLN